MNAFIDLILKISEAFDLDFLVSQIFEILAFVSQLALLVSNRIFQLIVLFFEFYRSWEFFKCFCQLLRRVISETKRLKLRLKNYKLLDIKKVNCLQNLFVFFKKQWSWIIFINNVFIKIISWFRFSFKTSLERKFFLIFSNKICFYEIEFYKELKVLSGGRINLFIFFSIFNEIQSVSKISYMPLFSRC